MSPGELPPGPASRPDNTGQIDRTPDAAAAGQSVESELGAVIERRVDPGSPIAQALRAQSAAADEVPSAALDASIRAAARRAVFAGPRALSSSGAGEASAVVAGGAPDRESAPQFRPWWQRAAVPMAAAAMIVLTVSVTTLVEQEHRSVEPRAVVSVPPAPPSASPGAVVSVPPAPLSASSGAVVSVPPAPPSAYPEARIDVLPRPVPGAGVPSPSAVAEPAFNASEISRGADHKRTAQAPVEPSSGPLTRTEAASSVAGAPAARAVQAAPAAAAAAAVPGPAVAAVGTAAANRGPALASAPEAQNEKPIDKPSDRPGTPMTRAQAPVADSAQSPAQVAGRQAADAVARPSASAAEVEQRVAPPASPAPAVSESTGRAEPRVAAKPSPPAPRSAEVAGRSARDPEKWLAEVLELRRAGREKDAEFALAEFRKVWPDYPLPAVLKPAR